MESELAFLKAQINPHSLFNSLNTVYGHIDKGQLYGPGYAAAVFRIALRYQLYDCGADKVSLGKEIGYIRNYVDFQRLRKNETLIVDCRYHFGHRDRVTNRSPCCSSSWWKMLFKFVSVNFPDRENRISNPDIHHRQGLVRFRRQYQCANGSAQAITTKKFTWHRHREFKTTCLDLLYMGVSQLRIHYGHRKRSI